MLNLTVVSLAMLGAWSLLLLAYRRRLRADWREPVLSTPVLIVESDDWGPGPAGDAERLRELAALLLGVRDHHRNPPVVTIGVVLAVPGPPGPGSSDSAPAYAPRSLEAAELAPIRDALLDGQRAGVFALQLHGMEHFWPAALLRAAAQDQRVRAFLAAEDGADRHEALPPHLQARWIDAAQLPSRPIERRAIAEAVASEAACFERAFGTRARVAVPVTFTWTTGVEEEWARNGIRVVVTPGTRYVGRDAHGRLVGDGTVLRNGDVGPDGLVYVVRDVYFEPALGHAADRVLAEVRGRHRLGRPALLEMHRFNFTGSGEQAGRSLDELRRLLRATLKEIPGLTFVSTEALAQAIASRDPAIVDQRFSARLRALLLRASTLSRLRKLAWATGLVVPAAIALFVASAFAARPVGRHGAAG